MLRRDRQSPRHSHTLSMGAAEGLTQNTETETRHQEDVDIGSTQKKKATTTLGICHYMFKVQICVPLFVT